MPCPREPEGPQGLGETTFSHSPGPVNRERKRVPGARRTARPGTCLQLGPRVADSPRVHEAGAVRDELAVFARYARGLPGWIREPISPAEARRRVEHRLRTRDE